MKCDKHNIHWEISDPMGCPVCYGEQKAAERIINWIEENRSGIEFEPGEIHYRDHFTSIDLIAFIKGENK